MLWLIASESMDGSIEAETAALAFRLRISEKELLSALKPLISGGFFDDASNTLATCKQLADPETETETDSETETETEPARRARGKFDAASVQGLNLEQWTRWVAYRTQLGKPIKPASMQAAAEQMAKLGHRQREAVDASIANGWQGLFPPKGNPSPASNPRVGSLAYTQAKAAEYREKLRAMGEEDDAIVF